MVGQKTVPAEIKNKPVSADTAAQAANSVFFFDQDRFLSVIQDPYAGGQARQARTQNNGIRLDARSFFAHLREYRHFRSGCCRSSAMVSLL